jgi:ribosomal protein S18 acetylase RimI-like enzyme
VQPTAQAPVRRAEPADYARASEVLSAAFADDPGWSFLLPRAEDREQRERRFFDSAFHHLVPARRQLWTSEDGSAAAVWGPPGLWSIPVPSVLRQGPAMVSVFGPRLPKALRYLIRIERSHPTEPHWYLEFLGAEPERQGQGLGSALLRPILALCDRDRVGAYLESSTDRSQALYERHGFEVVERFDMPGGGPPIRRMWRDPGGP